MEKKILGRTGLSITTLSLGGMSTRGMTQETANALFNTALDEGINYIDTAPEYTGSEELIGNAIAGRRSEYILATKCGDYLPANGPNALSPNIWYTKQVFLDNIHRSLKLLKTDHIDVMQMHGLMPEYLDGGERDELILLLEDQKREGTILHIGASLRNGRLGNELYPVGFAYNSLKTIYSWKCLEMLQVVYGALTRKLECGLARAAGEGLGLVARGAMKQYTPEYEEIYIRSGIDELREEDESRQDLLLRFALSLPSLTSVLVGTGDIGHLKANIRAAHRGPLSTEVYAEAIRRLDAAGVLADPFNV